MNPTTQFLISLFVCCAFSACEVELKNPEISLSWELIKNYDSPEGNQHEARFTLTNSGTSDLTSDNWKLYWNQSPRDIVRVEGDPDIKIRRINGDFYEMKPKPGFRLKPGASTSVLMVASYFMIKESDAPVGIYILNKKGDTKLLEEVHIAPFINPEQLQRNKNDLEPLATPENIYDQSKNLKVLPDEKLYPFIPHPKSITQEEGYFSLELIPKVFYSDNLNNEERYLMEGLGRKMAKVDKTEDAHIVLNLDESISKSEGYALTVSRDQIEIRGKDKAGIFYGITSLLGLMDLKKNQIPLCQIEDAPAYPYRGMHVDVARNFQSKETIQRLLDVMASIKLNKLLFVLTEDEAWRLDIEELPELVQVAGRRGHTLEENEYLQPAYGSGPDPENADSHGNGFYSREDFKAILKYAHKRHIEVIPVINFPGHARSAIRAMEKRYETYMKKGDETEAERYRLIDPEDASVYKSAQFYNDNIVCVCKEVVYDFYETVLEDIQEMYAEAEVPLGMIHTGGDEVPKGAWTNSPICKDYLKNYPEIKNIRNLQIHFFKKLTKRLESTNLKIGGWEEIVMEFDENNQSNISDEFANGKVYPYIWNNLWGAQDLGYRIANKGYPVVLCNVTNLYFDLAYNKDPRESGLYWGGFVSEWDAFSFVPENLFISTVRDNMGKPFDVEKDFAGMERLQNKNKKNIHGIQAQLWGETIKGRKMFEYYYIPKIYGLAQRAWQGMPEWSEIQDRGARDRALEKDYERFINTIVQKEFPRLDQPDKKYAFRIPAPGIKIESGKIYMNSPYPGMSIRYTTDGSEPDNSSEKYVQPFESGTQIIRAKVFSNTGQSGCDNHIIRENE